MIRRLKFTYELFNFFHKKKLVHNLPLYKKFGLAKKYYSPISSKDFKNIAEANLSNIKNPIDDKNTITKSTSDDTIKNTISSFQEQGFLIMNGYLSNNQVNEINQEIDTLLKTKQVKFENGNKIMFAIKKSAILRKIGCNPKLTEFLSTLMNGNAKLFQSINFMMGSEQKTHSDSIHMTTYPLRGLLGLWIALEDIGEDNGPLHYYPGSHRLPYYLNSDYENEGTRFLIGKKDYTEYEKMLESKIIEHGIKKVTFSAKKGDLLIWHANLLHGGEIHLNKERTRKSVVFIITI